MWRKKRILSQAAHSLNKIIWGLVTFCHGCFFLVHDSAEMVAFGAFKHSDSILNEQMRSRLMAGLQKFSLDELIYNLNI